MSEHKRHHTEEHVSELANELREHRTGLVLTGRITNGELHLDQATLDEIRNRFPDGDQSFIALNSPFDAESLAV
jgi:hypothetical protein